MSIATVLKGLQYVPKSAALKVLQKHFPKLKNYFSSAVSYGLDANSALDYLYDRFGKSEHQKGLEARPQEQLRPDEKVSLQEIKRSQIPLQAAKFGTAALTGSLLGKKENNQNLATQNEENPKDIQQEPKFSKDLGGYNRLLAQYPQVGKFLDQKMQQGFSPQEAALQAKTVRKLSDEISRIEDEAAMSLEDLIGILFGNQKPISKSSEISDKKSPLYSELIKALNEVKNYKPTR